MKKITLYTAIKKGGVLSWAKNLEKEINNYSNDFKIKLINNKKDLLLSNFFQADCDIIHSTNPIFIKPKKPYILTIHGDYNIEMKKNFYSKLFPLAIERADLITVPSNFLKNKLDLKKAIVIPNSIDTNSFKKAVKKNLYNLKILNFCTVTNFNIYEKCKGLFTLVSYLEIFQNISKKKINLHIAGSGDYFTEIKKKLEKNKEINIFFDGWVNNHTYYQDKDLFVYYSKLDTFGISLLEAMASNLNVLTNEFGAAKEIIPKEYIYKSKDDFLEKLFFIIKNNQDIFLKYEKWDNKNIIPKYLAIYRHIK